MVTVISTGFNRKAIVDNLNPNHETSNEVAKQHETQILAEKENLPLHEQSKQEELIPHKSTKEEYKPAMLFDESSQPLYGNDLEVPAFIRRQQD